MIEAEWQAKKLTKEYPATENAKHRQEPISAVIFDTRVRYRALRNLDRGAGPGLHQIWISAIVGQVDDDLRCRH